MSNEQYLIVSYFVIGTACAGLAYATYAVLATESGRVHRRRSRGRARRAFSPVVPAGLAPVRAGRVLFRGVYQLQSGHISEDHRRSLLSGGQESPTIGGHIFPPGLGPADLGPDSGPRLRLIRGARAQKGATTDRAPSNRRLSMPVRDFRQNQSVKPASQPAGFWRLPTVPRVSPSRRRIILRPQKTFLTLPLREGVRS